MIAKFPHWTVVAFTKIGNTGGADLEGRKGNCTFGPTEQVLNIIKHGYAACAA